MLQRKIVWSSFPLSVYIPLLLACAVIFPLLITIISSEIASRPALIAQSSTGMETDAKTRIQLIDAYFVERLKDIQMVSQFMPVRKFLLGYAQSQNEALDELVSVQHRDAANYISWSLFDAQGRQVLSYPTAPQLHGSYFILPEDFAQLQHANKQLVSDVFYDATRNQASVDLYARVISDNFHILGFVRASLELYHIWDIVDSETSASGPGSYALILDENGVRIAYTNPDPFGLTHPAALFKAIAPFSPAFAQRVKNENLYGSNKLPFSVQADRTLAASQNAVHSSSTFEITPSDQKQSFQAARYSSPVVPWTYIIFKPLSQVTSIADQQLRSTVLIGIIVLLLALLAGLTTARRITRPILRSVTFLLGSSQLLKTFSNQEYVIVQEQSWMVEASRLGLQSVRYYTNANSVAAARLQEICDELLNSSGYRDPEQVRRAVKELLGAAAYIQQATKYQDDTSEKLAAAIRVTTQVTDQLTVGAKSAEEAAIQLEGIVDQLRTLVGAATG